MKRTRRPDSNTSKVVCVLLPAVHTNSCCFTFLPTFSFLPISGGNEITYHIGISLIIKKVEHVFIPLVSFHVFSCVERLFRSFAQNFLADLSIPTHW